jgi:hypothetical protein
MAHRPNAALLGAPLLCGIAAWATVAAAQVPAAVDQQLQALTSQASYRTFLEVAVNEAEPRARKQSCTRPLTVLETRFFSVVKAPVFGTAANGAGIVSDGAWIAYVPVDRCGTQTMRRVLVTIPQPNALVPTPLLPGDFIGDLQLEVDATRIAYAALVAIGGCTADSSVVVLDIKAISKPSAQGWDETWWAIACGNAVSTNVHYRPSPINGTDITADRVQMSA